MRRALQILGALALATALWLPAVRLLFPTSRADAARGLTDRQLHLWTDPAAREAGAARMRRRNPEWDLMARSFLVWALANVALADPARKATALEVTDRVIDETLEREAKHGIHHYLMSYSRAGAFVVEPQASQFNDGEIALMLAARRTVEDKPEYHAPLTARVARMAERMEKSPVLSAESYPDECWSFCNSVALAAMRLADRLDGGDHSDLARRWIAVAKEKLLDKASGLLVSSYKVDGAHLDGPEGSSIWLVANMLLVVDEAFARDQYARARKELGRTVLGFGFAREWPTSWPGGKDVDSGPLVPVLEASPGASGMALVGAASFGDDGYLHALMRTLSLAAFPTRDTSGLRYEASNPVGDAVMLYALVQGPLWERARR
jgi:hypothetical protein